LPDKGVEAKVPTATSSPELSTSEPGRLARFRAGYLRRAPRLIATIAALLGIATLLEAVLPKERNLIHGVTRIIPVPASAAATAVVFVSGFLLLRVAAALRKRKRRAWRAAVVLTSVMTVAHTFRGVHRYGEAAITLALLIMLLTARSRFTAKSDPYTRWFAVRIGIQFMLSGIVLGMLMLYALDRSHRLVGNPSFGDRLREVVLAMFGINGPVVIRGERLDDILHATMLGFTLVTVVIVALLVLRPQEPIAQLSDEDEERLRGLLDRQGARDSLGYFALRRDKSVLWSPTGKSAITYRVVQGVALVSGDPIGDPEAWPGVIAEYRKLCDEYAWTPAVMGCSELGATIFKREQGLTALALGDEAIIEVKDFTLEGRAMRGVRQACTRVARGGYEVQLRRIRDVPAEEIEQLRHCAESWRVDDVERGYSMALGRLGDPTDTDCVLATATKDGVAQGMLHFVPWGKDGLSLDLMRREKNADNGLNEFMISKLIEGCPELGVDRVSLNFAVFRDALERGERIGAGPVLRAWRWLLIFVSRWWQIESLFRFNAKFRPIWETRFFSFPGPRDIPRVAIAALEAEAFIVRPHRLKRMLGRA
jgi:lysyl-tRNA synthetase class 2